MYKNLNTASLGIIGRQSELIELALTYRFQGLDLEARELIKRAGIHGVEEAAKYIRSGKVKVGGWRNPINIAANEKGFCGELDRLAPMAALAQQIGFTCCQIDIEAGSDELPFHENFERYRERLAKVGDLLSKYEIRLGVGFNAMASERQKFTYPFIQQSEELLTLLKSTASDNVGLALDTWQWRLGGGGNDQLEELDGKQFVCITIADIPLDADLQKIEADRRLLPSEDSIPEYGKLLASLSKGQYAGPVTLLPDPSQLKGLNRERSVEKCAAILESIWVAAGLSKSSRPAAVETEQAEESSEVAAS